MSFFAQSNRKIFALFLHFSSNLRPSLLLISTSSPPHLPWIPQPLQTLCLWHFMPGSSRRKPPWHNPMLVINCKNRKLVPSSTLITPLHRFINPTTTYLRRPRFPLTRSLPSSTPLSTFLLRLFEAASPQLNLHPRIHRPRSSPRTLNTPSLLTPDKLQLWICRTDWAGSLIRRPRRRRRRLGRRRVVSRVGRNETICITMRGCEGQRLGSHASTHAFDV